MSTFREQTVINASREAVWSALADIGSISAWNPGLVGSYQTSEGQPSMGATRHCDLSAGRFLDEEVVEWEPETVLTMRVVGTNLPFSTADIRFTLRERGNGILLTVSPAYELKFGLFGKLMDAVMVRLMYRKGMRDLLAGLKRHVEG